MSLYRVTATHLEPVPATTFAAATLQERRDIQRYLKHDISPIGDDLMVIAEEYGNWEDSHRRIDLLCLGKDASLVVVEIKRTEDGGHMELQAIRYASMVSSLTLDAVVQAYSGTRSIGAEEARKEITEFLDFENDDEAELTGDVRIVLASANFSTELTTAVLWLNRRDLNITCIRLRPYRMGEEILIDATQIIPLPESADFEVKVRAQEKEKRRARSARHETFRKFWTQFIERSLSKTQLLASRTAPEGHWINAAVGRSGFGLNTVLNQHRSQVECYLRHPGGDDLSTAAFQELEKQKDEIEQAFGGKLDWQELPGRKGCRICAEYPGGWKAPEAEWPDMQDKLIEGLIALEHALKQPIQDLSV